MSIYELMDLFIDGDSMTVTLYDNNGGRDVFWEGLYEDMPEPYRDLEIDSIDQPHDKYAMTVNIDLQDDEIMVKLGYEFATMMKEGWVNYSEAVECMDDSLREELHGRMSPCTEQDFFDAYRAEHEQRFDEWWDVEDRVTVW